MPIFFYLFFSDKTAFSLKIRPFQSNLLIHPVISILLFGYDQVYLVTEISVNMSVGISIEKELHDKCVL